MNRQRRNDHEMCDAASIQRLNEMLSNKISAKRRSAAKKLRRLKSEEAGPALVDAVKKELKDKRTWETQYQMIMALGESGYTEGLGFLYEISEKDFEATMINTAIGDAITVLEKINNCPFNSLSTWIDEDRKHLVEGGIRSLAINKFTPDNALINKIITYVEKTGNEDIVFWAAAASPSWPACLTNVFLNHCLEEPASDETKKAAEAALKGKHLKWNPL